MIWGLYVRSFDTAHLGIIREDVVLLLRFLQHWSFYNYPSGRSFSKLAGNAGRFGRGSRHMTDACSIWVTVQDPKLAQHDLSTCLVNCGMLWSVTQSPTPSPSERLRAQQADAMREEVAAVTRQLTKSTTHLVHFMHNISRCVPRDRVLLRVADAEERRSNLLDKVRPLLGTNMGEAGIYQNGH